MQTRSCHDYPYDMGMSNIEDTKKVLNIIGTNLLTKQRYITMYVLVL